MIARRELLGIGFAAMLSCVRSDGAYFGSTVLPKSRRLVHTLGGEIESLDPAKSIGSWEYYVIPALFEGLINHHPELADHPMAALATHYEVSPDRTRFTFYLRGHASPRGIRLPNTNALPREYSRGIGAQPDDVPARWSDGSLITAHDFVYSWRRFVDPQTAAPMAYLFAYIVNAVEISNGEYESTRLGVRAVDDFTFQVELRSPGPFFLNLISQYFFAAVPRRCVEAAKARGSESSWTEAQNIVTSGAFRLKEYRRYEHLLTVRNPAYYEAGLVSLDELAFYPVVDATTALHLYKTGGAAATPSAGFPPVFIPALRHKRDFHGAAALGGIASSISVRRPPFDNRLLRYAFNMATDKSAFSGLSHNSIAARTIVPLLPGYPSPESLYTLVSGRRCDVLSFNVEVARALLAKAGYPEGIRPDGRRLEITYHFPIGPETRPKADIHREQWQRHLGVKVNLVAREFNEHFRMVFAADYTGIAGFSFLPAYLDPNPFLEPFVTLGGNPSGWIDPAYQSRFLEANATVDPRVRMSSLAECETLLLAAMPIIPVYFPGFASLRKPFVRGFGSNPFDARPFKYTWIDTNWRPQ